MKSILNIGCSWSGGKDSCYALMEAQKSAVPKVLLNMMNENGLISRSHGLPFSLLHQQAEAITLPIMAVPTSWSNYEATFINTLVKIKSGYQVEGVVFGDIDLQAHRDWEEMVCEKSGVKAILPLWQKDRKRLLLEMLSAGIEAMIVSCNPALGEEFLGTFLTPGLIPILESKGVDVCGENGEFHTIVVNCPLFSRPVKLPQFSKIKQGDYYFINWEVEE